MNEAVGASRRKEKSSEEIGENMSKLSIKVNGRVIDSYKDKSNDVYVEGRSGSTYTIYYQNNTSYRQKVVLSVDGLNVMTGTPEWEMGYIVEPYGTLEVPGWSKDNNNVAQFVFSSVKDSYSTRTDNGEQNVGCVGAIVYNEKRHISYYDLNRIRNNIPWYDPFYEFNTGVPMVKTGVLRGIAVNNLSYSSATTTSQSSEAQNLQELGSGWGENKEFKVNEVSFNSETNPYATYIVYYDSVKGLERRGIKVKPPEPVKPNPFPGLNTSSFGCKPPK